VPVAEAWRSRAHEWDGATRDRVANDLGYSMSLIAISASSNLPKGDKDPTNWLPPNAYSFYEYVYSWVTVNVRLALAVDDAELATIKREWLGYSEADFSVQ